MQSIAKTATVYTAQRSKPKVELAENTIYFEESGVGWADHNWINETQ